ncbi:hypothetical protein DFH06DRAFT_1300868 [Mycena polygramma]|nr:hypothetical protein DFH06DRAFT_1300868 [Mycena polygramma]
MAPLAGEPLSLVGPALAKDIPIKPLAVIAAVVAIPLVVHHASPVRLTDNLEDAMSKARAAYTEAIADHLSVSEIATESKKLDDLKREVTSIKLETLRHSRSYRGSLWGFCKGRTFTVLRCIWKVQDFETEIKEKMLKAPRTDVSPSRLQVYSPESARNVTAYVLCALPRA